MRKKSKLAKTAPIRCPGCHHQMVKHHRAIGPKRHPESAEFYCECGDEDCWPGLYLPYRLVLDEYTANDIE